MEKEKKTALFVNACVHGAESRTQRIADIFLKETEKCFPQASITERNLMLLNPLFLNYFSFKQREELLSQGKYDHFNFDLANEFARADAIVIAAPFWDLSFPAVLRTYFENVSIPGISFNTTAQGYEGLCKAKVLVYITTRGGDYSRPPLSEYEMGERYIRALSKIFGIGRFECVSADGFDLDGADTELLMRQAEEKALEAARRLL